MFTFFQSVHLSAPVNINSVNVNSYVGASGPGGRLRHNIQRAYEALGKRCRAPTAYGPCSTKAIISLCSRKQCSLCQNGLCLHPCWKCNTFSVHCFSWIRGDLRIRILENGQPWPPKSPLHSQFYFSAVVGRRMPTPMPRRGQAHPKNGMLLLYCKYLRFCILKVKITCHC